MQIALGFRTHSGWAAVVGIGLSADGPVVCDRRRMALIVENPAGPKQPYHEAESMRIEDAKEFLHLCIDAAYGATAANLQCLIGELEASGHEVVRCAVLSAAGRIPDSVEAILESHAAIHSAEGELYRSAVEQACERCGLPVQRIPQIQAIESAIAALGLPSEEIEKSIGALGKKIGPPWTEDQKLAAMAAWITLAGANPKQRSEPAVRTA